MVVDMTLAAGPKSQGSTDTDGGSSASCPHPRIAERRQHVALVKAEEKLLLELDRLIDSLDHLSRLTSQFLNLRFIAQELRKETAILDMRSPEGLAFVEQIGRQMAEIKAALLSFDAVTFDNGGWPVTSSASRTPMSFHNVLLRMLF